MSPSLWCVAAALLCAIPWACAGGSGGGASCQADCGARVCGDDGCGGTCGACAAGFELCLGGLCVAADPRQPPDPDVVADSDGGTCTPWCPPGACGNDGCGGSCGPCGEGATCIEGQCTAIQDCGDDCGGLLAGNPDALCALFDPMAYKDGVLNCDADCTLDPSGCVSAGTQAFSPCDPEAPEPCGPGLGCRAFAPAGEGMWCLAPCAPEAGCGPIYQCVDVGQGDFVCLMEGATRDTPCWEDFRACAPGEGTCLTTQAGAGDPHTYRCKLGCEAVGSQLGCPGGEWCLPNAAGHVAPVQEDGAYLTCTPATTPCQDGQYCLPVSATEHFCYALMGWCGSPVPLCGGLDKDDQEACAAAQPCDASDASAYCAVGIGSIVPLSAPGFAVCVPQEGTAGGACVGFCELSNGQERQCGDGYVCVQPTKDQAMLYFVEQPAAPVPCQGDGDCASFQGYFCAVVTGDPAQKCYRGYKMCAGN